MEYVSRSNHYRTYAKLRNYVRFHAVGAVLRRTRPNATCIQTAPTSELRPSYITIVWTVFVEFITCFQSFSDFSQSFSQKRNSQKNKLDCTNGQSRRDEMSIEMAYLPSPKPRRGDMCIVLKLSKL